MKLCRFELASAPGFPRTGFVHEGKIYETEGMNPIGVYEWSEARLLAPVQRPPSFRLFLSGDDFTYLNPSLLFGNGEAAERPDYAKEMQTLPCLAVVIGGQGAIVSPDQADELILGLSLIDILHAPGEKGGRAFDAGAFIGPAITTPDELEDSVTEHPDGRRYHFSVALRINGEETERFDISALPTSIAQIISHASQSAPIRQGDLLAIALGSSERNLDKGDEVQLFSDKLGALTTRLV